MKKKKIIYLGGFELPDKNAAANRVMANSEVLLKMGFEVIFIGIDKTLNIKETKKQKGYEIGSYIYWSTFYPKNKFEWLRYLVSSDEIIRIIESYENIEAVICYNYQSVAFERVRRYCKKKGIKIIADCTEWYGDVEGSILFRLIKFLDTSFRMRVVNKKVDSLIVTSNFLNKYYNEKKSIIVPTLIPKYKKLNPFYNTSNIINFVYAGVPFKLGVPLKDRKLAKDRLDLALKLLHTLRKESNNFVFNIYGLTKKQYLEVLPEDQSLINDLGDCVIFHGRKKNKETQEAVNRSDFSLLIRDNNRMTQAGFPTKFTESINCSVPVITTKTSDLNKYLQEGKNGFFIDIHDEDGTYLKMKDILKMDLDKISKMKNFCFESKSLDSDNWEKSFWDVLK